MMRTGTTGGYKAELLPELYQKVDQAMLNQLSAAGSDFPYNRYLADK